MELFHTSPSKIEKITVGRFGESLFFSGHEYAMTAGEFVTYKIDINENEIIDASQLFYHDDAALLGSLVSELAARYEIDADTAESLIDESANIYEIECSIDAEDLADASWDIQSITARAAKMLGYRGVKVADEQGSAYMIDMTGRESELHIA